jgi:pyruvate formate lyase activating enzyme
MQSIQTSVMRKGVSSESLKVGGLTGITTIDFPGHLAAVVFCQGCPWRCPYCHNPHLLDKSGADLLRWEDVGDFMERRRGLLDGVVFSGGEPTAQACLLEAMGEMKDMGFLVGLHTAGPHPDRLAKLLPMLDWVALDIKAPFDEYDKITMIARSGDKARQSATLILEAGVPYEFRTTVYPETLDEAALMAMAKDLGKMGVRKYVLQKYRPLNAPLAAGAFVRPELIEIFGGMFDKFEVRQ